MTTYFGGKNASVRHLINQVPPHDTLIETHLGSGALMYRIRPARLQIGIDINPGVIAAHTAAITRNDDGAPTPDLTMLLACANARNSDDAGGIAIPDDAGLDDIAIPDDAAATPFPTMLPGERLFLCNDALTFLRTDSTWIHQPTTFVYADPPYLPYTRTSDHRYRFEYTIDDHVRLLNELNSLDCMVMISGYNSRLYNDHLSHWRKYEFRAMTRGGSQRTECLWMNYPEPAALHDYRYLGHTFRERERIKRLKTRWATRWRNMPRLQRQAVLAAIQEAG